MGQTQKHSTKNTLSTLVEELIKQQKESWELARTNYAGLSKIESKTFRYEDFSIVAQFNPERIRSSAAKTDAQSIKKRPCFLCAQNRPSEQIGIDFREKYTLLVNPYPIFQKHLTIALNEHLAQNITPYFSDMLDLSKALPEFTLFYNGAECGASAPDHFHFQAVNRNQMSIDLEIENITNTYGEELFRNKATTINAVGENYLRNLIRIQSSSAKEIAFHVLNLLDSLKTRNHDEEPMVNILCSYKNDEWNVTVFPRDKQRPSQFFAQGDEQILISPAAVELGGVAIVPRKEDFVKITKDQLTDIYRQVTINETDFDLLKDRIKKSDNQRHLDII